MYNFITFLCFDYRWDIQKFRELEMREKLIKGRNKKHHSQSVKKEELTTFCPDKANLNEIEFTDLLPVSVFGTNILIKKNSPPLVYRIFIFIIIYQFYV